MNIPVKKGVALEIALSRLFYFAYYPDESSTT